MPAANNYNYPRGGASRHHGSSRQDEKTTLPPISTLLRSPFDSQEPRDDSRSGDNRDDSRRYPPNPGHPRRTPYDRGDEHQPYPQPLPTPPAEERHRERTSYDRHPLPMHNGPPASQGRPPSEYMDRVAPSRSSYDYAGGPPPSNGASSYGGPGRYGRAPREPGSTLPPPPPFQGGHQPGYSGPTTPLNSYGDHSAAYGAGYSRQPPTYPPNGHQYPQYPPQQQPVPSPYQESSPGGYGRGEGMYESMDDRPARRRRGNLPKWATDYLKNWFFDHIAHPYPTEQEKQELCKITGLGMTQLSNWFINARRRQNPVLHAQAAAENDIRNRDHSSQASGGSDGASNNPTETGKI